MELGSDGKALLFQVFNQKRIHDRAILPRRVRALCKVWNSKFQKSGEDRVVFDVVTM